LAIHTWIVASPYEGEEEGAYVAQEAGDSIPVLDKDKVGMVSSRVGNEENGVDEMPWSVEEAGIGGVAEEDAVACEGEIAMGVGSEVSKCRGCQSS
jgi:hypothetical protein